MDEVFALDNEVKITICYFMKLIETYEAKKSNLLVNDPDLINDMGHIKKGVDQMMDLLDDKQKDEVIEYYKTYKLKPLE